MARPVTLVVAALALCLLLAPAGLAWYKQAAGLGYYSVGRAAGLLSGLRRSPYARRSEPPLGTKPQGRAFTFRELRPRLRGLVSAGHWRVRGVGVQGAGVPGAPSSLSCP